MASSPGRFLKFEPEEQIPPHVRLDGPDENARAVGVSLQHTIKVHATCELKLVKL